MESIGTTVCDHCNAKIRVPERYSRLVGKDVRCPRCHELFTMVLNGQVAVPEKPKRTRRTQSQIRQDEVDKILAGFQSLYPRLAELSQRPRSSEEDIRLWVVDALREALGYSVDQIFTEAPTPGGPADILLRGNDAPLMVIETKRVAATLKKTSARKQATKYAALLGAKWAVTSNGRTWRLFRVNYAEGRPPQPILIFDVALLDDDGVSESDAANLYYLSAHAMSCGDTEREYHAVACTAEHRMQSAILSPKIVASIRRQLLRTYEAETGYKARLSDARIMNAIRGASISIELK